MKNTVKSGSVRYIVFKEKTVWYAAALEFNIVVYADDPQIALFNLLQSINGYIKSFKKIKGARPFALNQKTDPEYESLWETLQSNKKQSVKSPLQVHTFGRQLV